MVFGCVTEDKEVTIVRLKDELDANVYVCTYYVIYIYIYIYTFFHYQEKNLVYTRSYKLQATKKLPFC